MTLWIKHVAALLTLTSSFGGYRYYRYQFKQHNHQHADGTWHDNIGCVHEVPLSLVASPVQKTWLEGAVTAFNSSHRGRVRVSITYTEDRDALQDLLSGKLKPTLWSPGANLWADRLNTSYTGQKDKTGTLIRWNSPNTARTYFQTSLVLLTDKKSAKTAGIEGQNLERFSHTNPASDSSGFFTLGVLLAEYKQTLSDEQKKSSTEAIAKSERFLAFLRKREQTMFYDEAGESGTIALTRSFTKKPAHYGAIWTWKSTATEALQKRDDITILAPKTPVIAQQSVVLLNTPGVTDDQREATEQFLTYLATPKAMAFGVKAGFDPVNSSTESADYDSLNAATYQWRRLRIAPEL